eukprot:12059732-Alexandrium_andersonii.AAC.1
MATYLTLGTAPFAASPPLRVREAPSRVATACTTPASGTIATTMAWPPAAPAAAQNTSPSTDAGPTRRTTHAGAPSAGETPGAQLDQRRNSGQVVATAYTRNALTASCPSQVARPDARAAKPRTGGGGEDHQSVGAPWSGSP